MSTSTNQTSLSYIEEVTAGTTPNTPAFQLLPTLSGGPQGNLSTAESEVINESRSVDDIIVVDSEVGGSINFELSYTPYKHMLEALMQSAVSTDSFSATDISIIVVSGQSVTINTAAIEDFTSGNLVVDQHIKLSGFVGGNILGNGIYRIDSIAALQLEATRIDSTAVTVPSGDPVTVTGRVIRNGTANPVSYTYVKKITGIATTSYMYYRGCQVSSLNLNFETGAILKGSYDVVGLTEDVTESAIAGQSFVDVPDYSVMNSVTSVANLLVDGLATDTEFSSFNLTYDNNINRAKAIGTLGAVGLSSFTLSASASTTIYFEDISAYTSYLASTSFAVTLITKDASDNYLVFRMPKCKFESLETPVPGKDNFFMLNGSIKALQDATLGYTMQIDVL